VLGVLAMIDSNETDWKVIAINVKDPNAARYNNITDVPQVGWVGWWQGMRFIPMSTFFWVVDGCHNVSTTIDKRYHARSVMCPCCGP
jgi:hypothetical protein